MLVRPLLVDLLARGRVAMRRLHVEQPEHVDFGGLTVPRKLPRFPHAHGEALVPAKVAHETHGCGAKDAAKDLNEVGTELLIAATTSELHCAQSLWRIVKSADI